MEKTNLGSKVLLYPVPLALIGSQVKGKPTYNLVGNFGIMCLSPATIYVSSYKGHYTNIGIRNNQVFSVNLPSADLAVRTDYAGLKSGHKVDKSELFETFYGELKTAPMAKECPVSMSCKVIMYFMVGEMEVFVGEVIDCYVNADLAKEKGSPDMEKVNPLIYGIDFQYFKLGENIGRAYKLGKEYSEK